MAVAAKLAQDKTSPGAILDLYNKGKLEALGGDAAKQLDKHVAADPHASAPHGKQHSYVAALHSKTNPSQPVLGKHTKGVVEGVLEANTSPMAGRPV